MLQSPFETPNPTMPGEMQQTSPSQEEAPRQPALSLKYRFTCDACATAKVKCCRTKPVCQRCQERGKECIYSRSRRGGRPRPFKRQQRPLRADDWNSTTKAQSRLPLVDPPMFQTPASTVPYDPAFFSTTPDSDAWCAKPAHIHLAQPVPVATTSPMNLLDFDLQQPESGDQDTYQPSQFFHMSHFGLPTPEHDFVATARETSYAAASMVDASSPESTDSSSAQSVRNIYPVQYQTNTTSACEQPSLSLVLSSSVQKSPSLAPMEVTRPSMTGKDVSRNNSFDSAISTNDVVKPNSARAGNIDALSSLAHRFTSGATDLLYCGESTAQRQVILSMVMTLESLNGLLKTM